MKLTASRNLKRPLLALLTDLQTHENRPIRSGAIRGG